MLTKLVSPVLFLIILPLLTFGDLDRVGKFTPQDTTESSFGINLADNYDRKQTVAEEHVFQVFGTWVPTSVVTPGVAGTQTGTLTNYSMPFKLLWEQPPA